MGLVISVVIRPPWSCYVTTLTVLSGVSEHTTTLWFLSTQQRLSKWQQDERTMFLSQLHSLALHQPHLLLIVGMVFKKRNPPNMLFYWTCSNPTVGWKEGTKKETEAITFRLSRLTWTWSFFDMSLWTKINAPSCTLSVAYRICSPLKWARRITWISIT